MTESTKRETTEFIHKFFRELTIGLQLDFEKNFGVNLNEPFHMQHYGIWHIGNKRLCESSVRKSFQYQIAEFCCQVLNRSDGMKKKWM